jgi:hypothetical protein
MVRNFVHPNFVAKSAPGMGYLDPNEVLGVSEK